MAAISVTAFIEGLGLGAGLIIAIGAQNAYVLRQGLRRRHVFLVASLCFIVDAALIGLGAGGLAALVRRFPAFTDIAAWGGAVFLLAYGLRAFAAAFHPGALDARAAGDESRGTGARGAALAALSLSLLNPHVYLDTVVLIGGLAAQYPPAPRLAFALGAMLASMIWFYGLGYGAARLAPLFARPAAWRALDIGVGCVMWAIAGGLVSAQIAG